MWVATASGRLMGPAAVWFTNWASQETEVTWAAFQDATSSRYSKTFLPIVVGTPLLAIKHTGSIPEYLAAWKQALAAAPEAIINRNAMLLRQPPELTHSASQLLNVDNFLTFSKLTLFWYLSAGIGHFQN
ncbi:hypothetical protein DSO57_1029946 [Entomophthora muscae]|uniref:Uncharacterized protein n=1 Tax=Entomophthora muscae TaxID=34485 RepID=A0ACC2TYX9_9FUNG|nr:hypothetical protein DSO57_1029946 [Entomophthora muscae]